MLLRKDCPGGVFDELFQAELGSQDAQCEVLEEVLAWLQRHCPDLYDIDEYKVKIKATGEELLRQSPPYNSRPLLLASLLVQEDFVILKPAPRPAGAEPDDGFQSHHFVAGCCCFSFTEMGLKGERGFMRLGNSMDEIHGPVPGYKLHLRAMLDRIFTKLKPEQPFYRANWAVVPSGVLSPHAPDPDAENGNDDGDGRGGDGAEAKSKSKGGNSHHMYNFSRAQDNLDAPVFAMDPDADPADMFLRVEYQTIRRLPRTGYILFGLHTYIDPLRNLEGTPRAASVLASTIKHLTPAQRKYRDMADDKPREKIINYLSGLGHKAHAYSL